MIYYGWIWSIIFVLFVYRVCLLIVFDCGCLCPCVCGFVVCVCGLLFCFVFDLGWFTYVDVLFLIVGELFYG